MPLLDSPSQPFCRVQRILGRRTRTTIDSRIVTNVIATYVRNQVVHGKLNQKYAEQQEINTNEQTRPEDQTEVQLVLNYMRDHFSLRDQEIMHLYIAKEDYKSIAEISGMTPGSIANTISKLKHREVFPHSNLSSRVHSDIVSRNGSCVTYFSLVKLEG